MPCKSCRRDNCASVELFDAAFQATNNAIEHSSSDDLRDWFSGAATLAWMRSDAEREACNKASDAIVMMYKHEAVFIRAKGETRERRERFSKAIALGMAQAYNNKQCGATMLCMRGAR